MTATDDPAVAKAKIIVGAAVPAPFRIDAAVPSYDIQLYLSTQAEAALLDVYCSLNQSPTTSFATNSDTDSPNFGIKIPPTKPTRPTTASPSCSTKVATPSPNFENTITAVAPNLLKNEPSCPSLYASIAET